MQTKLKTSELERAIEACAEEPVHIPGHIQPFCVLVAYEIATGVVAYASQNVADVFGRPMIEILGREMRDVIGSKIWHELQNAAQLRNISSKRYLVGVGTLAARERAVFAHQSGDYMVIEIEIETPDILDPLASVHEHTYLFDRIRGIEDQDTLLSHTVKLLRDVTGFDRVMAYAFSPEGHGEVVAESCRSTLEPMLNLRFPETDIPAQARAIMHHLPLRVISDVDQITIPVHASGPERPALDLTLTEARGVSPVHLQYLRNMKSAATMTLSVVVGDTLWGIISFHHQNPKLCPLRIRLMLLAFLPVLTLKLEQVTARERLRLAHRVDDLQAEIQSSLKKDVELPELLQKAAPLIFDALNVQGITVVTAAQVYSVGNVPEKAVLDALAERTEKAEGQEFFTTCLSTSLPELDTKLKMAAGALATGFEDKGYVFLFRNQVARDVAWAGNPEKTIEVGDGEPRLNPRTSFSKYLSHVSDHCDPWSDADRRLMRRLWPLISAAERTAFLGQLGRQQNLMIEELNHRVRNILAVVKSISKQAIGAGGSVESYAKSLEARIHALAAAHDMGAGAARASVSIMAILNVERQPHNADGLERIAIRGQDYFVKADFAPILALVLHELMTNAAKYGGLSTDPGRVDVQCAKADGGICIFWQEKGGPPVKKPKSKGFGTNLIVHAVQHEMGGKSTMTFDEAGFSAQIFLPDTILDHKDRAALNQSRTEVALDTLDVPEAYKDGYVMIVDDNFMIASDLRSDVEAAGFRNVDVCSNISDALAAIERERVMFALLDVNLGQGQTSEQVAEKLKDRNVPFLFVTGYGDAFGMVGRMNDVVCLTKPVSNVELLSALARLPLQRP